MSKKVILSRSNKALLVNADASERTAFPKAPKIVVNGTEKLIVEHDEQAVVKLRDLGYDAPFPFMIYYPWDQVKPPAFAIQKLTGGLVTTYRRAYIFNDMGTGKTRAVLWAFDYLKRIGRARKMLVVAPLSTLQRVWRREILAAVPHLRSLVLHDTAKRRRQLLAEDADIYILNHDGVKVIGRDLLLRPDIDVLAIDELAAFRNATTGRFKALREIAATRTYVWGLTGSPTPQAPTDAWALARIVTPWTAPMSFSAFRAMTMYRPTPFHWLPKSTAMNAVHQVLQPAVRFTLDDVIELPEIVYRVVDVEQSDEQNKAYAELKRHLQIMHKNNQITAVNSGVLLGKLLQISIGWVYGENRAVVTFDNKNRLDTICDIIDDIANKVIVFVPYIHALHGISRKIEEHGHTVAVVSGDTSPSERAKIFAAFQDDKNPKVLVAHPQCMAHGLTLTAADTIIWASPITSLEVYEQANARIRRVGQNHRQQILVLVGTEAERLTYRALQKKQQVQDVLLELLQVQTENVFA